MALIEEKDNEEFLRLAKVVRPIHTDIESIYYLYKKYVDPQAYPPSLSGCSSCGNGVVAYWRRLMEWFNKNK